MRKPRHLHRGGCVGSTSRPGLGDRSDPTHAGRRGRHHDAGGQQLRRTDGRHRTGQACAARRYAGGARAAVRERPHDCGTDRRARLFRASDRSPRRGYAHRVVRYRVVPGRYGGQHGAARRGRGPDRSRGAQPRPSGSRRRVPGAGPVAASQRAAAHRASAGLQPSPIRHSRPRTLGAPDTQPFRTGGGRTRGHRAAPALAAPGRLVTHHR